MKRRDFFKRLGIGAAALVAAPLVLGRDTEEPVRFDSMEGRVKSDWETHRFTHTYTAKEIFEGHRKTGILYCQPKIDVQYL